MAGLPEVIGLLYRADWTRVSLSAELRFETDQEPLPCLARERWSRWYRTWPGQQQDNGRYVGRGALLIGPGGRWRLECSVPGRGAEGEAAEGNDGEGGWSWRPPEVGGPPPLPVGLGAAYPPPAELFCPSCLLGGYTLEALGPVTVAGRGAIAVAAMPRRDVLSSVPGRRFHDRISHDRIEVAVDAELGILLRRIETSGGELVVLTEPTDMTMNPPEAADPARFSPPPGSNRSESPAAGPPKWLTGPVGKNAVGLAAGDLGALIRYAPQRPGHGPLVIWSELDDISTEPAGPDEFRVHVPPGTRTVEETGNLIADTFATMPGLTGTAVRAAAEAVNRTAGAVSAARSFLEDLRGHR